MRVLIGGLLVLLLVLFVRQPVAKVAHVPALSVPPKVLVLGQPAPPEFEPESVPSPQDEVDRINSELREATEKVKALGWDELDALCKFHDEHCDECKDHTSMCIEHFAAIKEMMSRPEAQNVKAFPEAQAEIARQLKEFADKASAPPLIDPDLVRKEDLAKLESKVDELLARPAGLTALPTEEIATRVAEKVEDKVVDKIVDGVATKVVDKITSAILKFQTADGKTRTEVVKSSTVRGSDEIVLNPGEVLTHIDGKPVNQTSALAPFRSGWIQSDTAIMETPAYQVQGVSKNRVRLVPQSISSRVSGSNCRMVNGVKVCN